MTGTQARAHEQQTPQGQEPVGRAGVLAMPPRPAGPGVAGWARWAWRTLTSMRSALILLALLALAAVPGSVLPQRGVSSDPNAVVSFARDHPVLAPWLERLGLFEVYSSPWFAAVYLLLLISMTGCVLPRCARLWRATRADPPRAPSNLSGLEGYRRWQADRPAAEVLTSASAQLRQRRFRVRVDAETVRAEKGYLREAGNLLFHLSLLVLLFGVAAGALFGYEGRVIVVEGAGFSNAQSQYDEFTPGPLTDPARLTPFSFTLRKFTASFEPTGPQRGTPRDFRAHIEVNTGAPGAPQQQTIEVNHPLEVDGTKVFLTGNGYAPQVSVRDGRGTTVFTGPVAFLPRDANLASQGVIKAPDAQPTQLGFEGLFLPTGAVDPATGPYSAFPDALNPRLVMTVYTGDLGLGGGAPQSVYTLDKTNLTQVTINGQPFAQALTVGQTMTLPNGQGTLTFDGVARFAHFQIANDPGKQLSLVAATLLLVGLTGSLMIPRRRLWVRARPAPDGTSSIVEVATLALTRRSPPPEELADLARTGAAATPDPLPTVRAAGAPAEAPSAPAKE